MACFADTNVSQGSVATYARCGGILNIHLTTNLPRNLLVKKNFNRLRSDRIMAMSHFLAHSVHLYSPSLWSNKMSLFGTARLLCGVGFASVGRPSVCLSVRLSLPAWAYSSEPAVAGLLLWARPAENIDRLLHDPQQRGVCGGQMRVVPRRQRTQEAEHRLVIF